MQRITNMFKYGLFKTDDQIMKDELKQFERVVNEKVSDMLDDVHLDVLCETVKEVKALKVEVYTLKEKVESLIIKTPTKVHDKKTSTKKTKSKK
jgi:hypothetical protein